MRTIRSYISTDSENSSMSGSVQRKENGFNLYVSPISRHLCPLSILKFSLRRTVSIGSATSTICVINKKELTALNLGDSGFLLIRFDNVTNEPYILIKSVEQTHNFNSPY